MVNHNIAAFMTEESPQAILQWYCESALCTRICRSIDMMCSCVRHYDLHTACFRYCQLCQSPTKVVIHNSISQTNAYTIHNQF